MDVGWASADCRYGGREIESSDTFAPNCELYSYCRVPRSFWWWEANARLHPRVGLLLWVWSRNRRPSPVDVTRETHPSSLAVLSDGGVDLDLDQGMVHMQVVPHMVLGSAFSMLGFYVHVLAYRTVHELVAQRHRQFRHAGQDEESGLDNFQPDRLIFQFDPVDRGWWFSSLVRSINSACLMVATHQFLIIHSGRGDLWPEGNLTLPDWVVDRCRPSRNGNRVVLRRNITSEAREGCHLVIKGVTRSGV